MRKNKSQSEKREREKLSFGYSIKDVFCEKPNIEISDNTLATIEGSRGVLEYSQTIIRINLGSYTVAFCGQRLNLKCISPTALVVEGVFQNIEFGV